MVTSQKRAELMLKWAGLNDSFGHRVEAKFNDLEKDFKFFFFFCVVGGVNGGAGWPLNTMLSIFFFIISHICSLGIVWD